MSPVTLFTKPGCQGCRMTARFLKSKNVPFTAVDVTEDEDALDTVKGLGYQSLPVVTVGQDHWSGYQPDRLSSLTMAMA